MVRFIRSVHVLIDSRCGRPVLTGGVLAEKRRIRIRTSFLPVPGYLETKNANEDAYRRG